MIATTERPARAPARPTREQQASRRARAGSPSSSSRPAASNLVAIRPSNAKPQLTRTRRVVAIAIVAVPLSLFGVVASHVALAQSQLQLNQLQNDAAAKQTRYDKMRLQVAELESPGRIVATAQQRLGMVTPPKVNYLAPSEHARPQATVEDSDRGVSAPAPGDWSAVKSQLADG